MQLEVVGHCRSPIPDNLDPTCHMTWNDIIIIIIKTDTHTSAISVRMFGPCLLAPPSHKDLLLEISIWNSPFLHFPSRSLFPSFRWVILTQCVQALGRSRGAVAMGNHKLHPCQFPLPGPIDKDRRQTNIPMDQATVIAQKTNSFLYNTLYT